MSTLVLTIFGGLFGPIGAALGGLIGQQLDQALFGPKRGDSRLKELSVTTSSYGIAIARQHGRVRATGSMIWATDPAESSEATGGKGLTFGSGYAASFAVALSSRPIVGLGRVWADGNLLRGAAGDLKVGGTMRLYRGHGDHPVDALIASDKGADCPAFRHTAYVVFENLQLSDFGNRIPALTFEVIADDGEVSLAEILQPLDETLSIERALTGLAGFGYEGWPLSDVLAALDAAWPLAVDAGGDRLALLAADDLPADPPVLPEPAAAKHEDSFGGSSGFRKSHAAGDTEIPEGLRYYDLDRDYLAGLQRADGRARPGRGTTIELPATLSAAMARALVNSAAERAAWANETIEWRLAELDPELAPGTVVRIPGQAGNWRITGWEWNDEGVTLELQRMPRGPARQPAADSGSVSSPPDDLATPTLLKAFELP